MFHLGYPLSVLSRKCIFCISHKVREQFISIRLSDFAFNYPDFVCCQRISRPNFLKSLQLHPGSDGTGSNHKNFRGPNLPF